MNHTEAVEQMLRNLDEWRKLPKYQLERRSDLFFGLFIRQIVAGHIGCDESEIHPVVIPEFPFKYNKRGLKTCHTVNFDYVLFSSNRDTMYIIELKTDPDSYRKEQEKYLREAVQVKFSGIIDGLNEVIKATSVNKRHKYLCLKKLLVTANLVKDQNDFVATSGCQSIKLLYLGPPPSDAKIAANLRENNILIELKDAADTLKEKGELEKLFADYLVKWQADVAGSVCND